ncbi:MAG: DUF4037 domain-containing protein [Weeksellaceae bacterium]
MQNSFKSQSYIERCRNFYHSVVRPLIIAEYPKLKYSVAVIGKNDALNVPKLQFFFVESEFAKAQLLIDELFKKKLKQEYLGIYEFDTITSFYQQHLHYNPYKKISTRDWLSFSQEALSFLSTGEVIDDGLKKLIFIRNKFKYYPSDVWLYLYLSEWDFISTKKLVNSSVIYEDEVTFELVLSNISESLLRLCFFMEKQYIPGLKYMGNCIKQLPNIDQFILFLNTVLTDHNDKKRVSSLYSLYELILAKHNSLGLTKTMKVESIQTALGEQNVINSQQIVNELGDIVNLAFYRRLRYKMD